MTIRLSLACFLISSSLVSQKLNQLKLQYNIIGHEFVQPKDLDGAGSADAFNSHEIGMRFNRKLTKQLRLEAGFSYFSSTVALKSAPLPETNTYTDKLELLSFPVGILLDIENYFYVNGHILIDAQLNENRLLASQSGIGFALGVAGKYDYKSFAFYLNPEFRRHRIIGFVDEQYPEYLMGFGFQFGVGYNF